MTPTDFAQKIKAKYPQYASVDDATLTNKMLEKYPQYRSKVTIEDTRDFFQKATDFVKASPLAVAAPLGEAVGNSVYGIGKAAGQALKGDFGGAGQTIQETGAANNKNYEKIVGSAIGSAALPTSLAVGGGATVASNAARFGAVSAVSGGAESLSRGNDFTTAAVDAFKSGLTGTALGAGTKVASNIAKGITNKAPEALYNNSLKVLQKIKTAGKSPAEFLKDEGVWGNLGTFKKAALEGMNAENTIIKQAAANAKGGIRYEEIGGAAFKSLKSQLGDLFTDQEIQQLIDKVPLSRIKNAKGLVPWVDADGARAALGKYVGDAKWLSTTPSEQTKATKAVYAALSDAVKKATGTDKNFARYSKWIQTNKVVDRALAQADSKWGLGMYDRLSAIGGGVFGFSSGDTLEERVKNAAIGTAGAVAFERLATSPALKTAFAQAIEKLGGLPTDSLGRVSRAAVAQLIADIMATNSTDPQEDQ